jgi:outer membrane protein OmpA-like peptidoglycan-associated protein
MSDNDFHNSQIKSFQIPANLMVAEFGEVNVRRSLVTPNSPTSECHVEFTIAMEPQGQFAEGWRTGLALDASASMKRAYGRKVEARVDPELLTGYIKQGRLQAYMEDGEPTRKIQREAFVEIQEKGYEVNYTENILQPLVQDFTAYLADNLDGTGKTSLIYWGCGKGDEIQVLGEFDAVTCQQIKVSGPKTFQLGKTTKLCPAIAYFANQYQQAQRSIYIFLTDGRIDDLEQVKDYTRELALEITVGKRNYLKLILVGIGNDIDRYQLQELDDFDTGLDIDLWDYKIASEMTNLSQIFAELVNENQIIAESGDIYDDRGNCVKSYPQGLPAKVDFVMPNDSEWFELEVGGQRIRQSVAVGSAISIAPLVKKKLFDFELDAQESYRPDALMTPNQSINQDSEPDLNQDSTNNQIPIQTYRWKWMAALLIGAAFMGIAIAFGILIKRSDDRRQENQTISIVNKDVKPNSKSDPINKLNNNSLVTTVKSNPTSSDNNSSSLPNTSSKSTAKPISKSTNDSSIISEQNLINSVNNSASKPVRNPQKTSDQTTENTSPKNTTNNFVVNNSTVKPQKESTNLGVCDSFGICFTDSNKLPVNNSNQSSRLNNTNSLVNPSANPSINSLKPENQIKNSDRNNTASIVPISNPDVEAIIFFPSDDFQLMPPEGTKIDKFLAKIQGRRGVIQVSGHADVMGDYTYNLDLSQARANEVVKQLRDRGIDNNYRITFEALSSSHPLRKNATTTDNAFNRRVVIQFQEQK